jgi:hypothetical protein
LKELKRTAFFFRWRRVEHRSSTQQPCLPKGGVVTRRRPNHAAQCDGDWSNPVIIRRTVIGLILATTAATTLSACGEGKSASERATAGDVQPKSTIRERRPPDDKKDRSEKSGPGPKQDGQ